MAQSLYAKPAAQNPNEIPFVASVTHLFPVVVKGTLLRSPELLTVPRFWLNMD